MTVTMICTDHGQGAMWTSVLLLAICALLYAVYVALNGLLRKRFASAICIVIYYYHYNDDDDDDDEIAYFSVR